MGVTGEVAEVPGEVADLILRLARVLPRGAVDRLLEYAERRYTGSISLNFQEGVILSGDHRDHQVFPRQTCTSTGRS